MGVAPIIAERDARLLLWAASRPISDLGPATLATPDEPNDGRALVADLVAACRATAKAG
jgi:hypothetical protein